MNSLMIVTTSYPQHETDGATAAGAFVADLACVLAKTLPVDVIAPANTSSLTENGGLSVHRFAVPSLPLSLLSATRPSHWPNIVRTLKAGSDVVHSISSERRPAHILALWALPSGLWARSAALNLGIPYSVWALGSDIWSLGKIPIIRRLLRKILREANQCYADGIRLSSDVEKIADVACTFHPSSRSFPKRLRKPRTTGSPLRLAFLGRWHQNKGIDLLLQALDLLKPEDWARIESIKITGGGPLDKDVRNNCKAMRNNGKPVYDGDYLDIKGAADLLYWADYLLLPSRIESIPVVYSDAMQAGCPIIATPAGDLPHLFRKYGHSTGVLANTISPESFAAAIHDAISRDRMTTKNNCAQAAEFFDIDAASMRLLSNMKLNHTATDQQE